MPSHSADEDSVVFERAKEACIDVLQELGRLQRGGI